MTASPKDTGFEFQPYYGICTFGRAPHLRDTSGADVAIVTAIPGTTRDKVMETIQIDGVPVNLIDTAGIRSSDEAGDEVERIGIERTWTEVGRADVILHLLDADRGPTLLPAAVTTGAPPRNSATGAASSVADMTTSLRSGRDSF